MSEEPYHSLRFRRFVKLGRHCNAFEDVPLNLYLYDFLHPNAKMTGVYVDRDDQPFRHGKKWGSSSTWDRVSPHYMLPSDIVRRYPPIGTNLYITGAQPFDFIYSTDELVKLLSRHHRTKGNFRQNVYFKFIDNAKYMDSMIDIVNNQEFDTTEGWRLQFSNMLTHISNPDNHLSDLCKIIGLFDRMDLLIGFAILWIEEDGHDNFPVCYHVHRYMRKHARKFSRLFDLEIAMYALRRGCNTINIGDAHRTPGLAAYKFELHPVKLGHYVNVLDHAEIMDHERAY